MLVMLAQDTTSHRAWLAAGMLNAHEVEAHVFHDHAAHLYGAGAMVPSVWVRDDEAEAAREILKAAPGDLEGIEFPPDDGISRAVEVFPPFGLVALTVGLVYFATQLLTFALHIVDAIFFTEAGWVRLDFMRQTVPQTLVAVLISGVLSETLFGILRLQRRGHWFGVLVLFLFGVVIAFVSLQ